MKYAVLLSSLVASSALFAQNTPPAQAPAPAAKAAGPTQVAQGQVVAPAAGTAGGTATGVAAGTAGAAAGAGFAVVPVAVAAGMGAVSAAAISEAGNNSSATPQH